MEICRSLLSHGADVNIADNAGDRMLHDLAALFPNETTATPMMETLALKVLDKGAELEAKNKNGLIPLYLAIQHDNVRLVDCS